MFRSICLSSLALVLSFCMWSCDDDSNPTNGGNGDKIVKKLLLTIDGDEYVGEAVALIAQNELGITGEAEHDNNTVNVMITVLDASAGQHGLGDATLQVTTESTIYIASSGTSSLGAELDINITEIESDVKGTFTGKAFGSVGGQLGSIEITEGEFDIQGKAVTRN